MALSYSQALSQCVESATRVSRELEAERENSLWLGLKYLRFQPPSDSLPGMIDRQALSHVTQTLLVTHLLCSPFPHRPAGNRPGESDPIFIENDKLTLD